MTPQTLRNDLEKELFGTMKKKNESVVEAMKKYFEADPNNKIPITSSRRCLCISSMVTTPSNQEEKLKPPVSGNYGKEAPVIVAR